MSIQHRPAPHSTQSGGSFWDKQDNNSISYKFQLYDKNKDGLLDKGEFRSLLKDVFSTQASSQILDDAIEETVWRVQRVDLVAATHAVDSIKDTFQVDPKPISAPYTLSKPSVPFNAQGQLQQQQQQQLQHPAPTTVPSNPYNNIPSNPYNQYNQLNPFMNSAPPAPREHAPTPPPFVDPHTLPPPPLHPLNTMADFPPIPPPPFQDAAGVGSLKKAPVPLPRAAPNTTARPMPTPLKAPTSKNQPQAKMPAKLAAKTAAKVLPTSGELRQENTLPVRLFPSGSVASHPPLHSVNSEEDCRAFVEYINTSAAMKDDPDVKGILPISTNSTQIYQIVSEGWLLCKLLNAIQATIIPPAQIKLRPKNAFEKIENHTLAINAARKLGCKTVNIGPEDLLQGKPRLVLGLLWQIIKRDVLSKVSLAQHPEIYKLAKNTNNLKEISDCSPEEVLIKWANHHLQRAQNGTLISNFSSDVKDGSTYTLLMNQIAPDVCNTDALRETDVQRRAQMVVENAKKLNCDRFVTAADIVNGNAKLNLAFVADLFNKHSGLELPTLEEMEKLKKQNANMTNILDEAEARLRQILADGRLAHELQQEEILLYRQRKLKEQEQLAEQEAMLRAQVQQEEFMMLQQQRMKEMSLKEQEQFAREEQRKEEMRVGQRQGSSSSSSSSSYSRSSSQQSGMKASSAATNSYQSSAPAHAPAPSSYQSSAPAHPTPSYQAAPAPSYSQPQHSAAQSYGQSGSYQTDYYSAANNNAASYQAAPAPAPAPSYAAPSSYGAPQASSSYPPTSYPSAGQSYTTTSAGPNYTSTTYSSTDSNPYNVYSTGPSSSSSYTSTQTVYTEPPPIASYVLPSDGSPIQTRRRGVFERVGKKIDRAFH